ncbi:hypothetical protein T11_4269, partial [Trichinella zimbabwensis]
LLMESDEIQFVCDEMRRLRFSFVLVPAVVYTSCFHEPQLGVPLDLVTFVCDFETALISAIQVNFPNIRVQGCFFHFFQVVLQQVGRLGLKTDYIRNQEVRKKSKNANDISIFAGKPCTREFRNLK